MKNERNKKKTEESVGTVSKKIKNVERNKHNEIQQK